MVGAATTSSVAPRVGVDFAFWRQADVSESIFRTVAQAVDDLARGGVDVVEVSVPELELCLPITLVVCASEATSCHRTVLGHRAAALDPRTRVLLELGLVASPDDVALALAARSRAARADEDTFDRHG